MQTVIVNARFLTQQMTGVQRFASEISLLLKKEFDNIIFVAPKNIKNQELADFLEVQAFGKFSGHLWEQFELPLFAKNYQGALLLNLCNTAPVMYKKKIVTIHDLAFYHHPEWFSLIFRNYYNFLIPRVIRSAELILTVSEASREDLKQSFDIKPGKIKVIYNGVDSRFGQALVMPESLTFPKIFDDKTIDPYILAVSSLDPRKNFKRLIEAFNNLFDKSIKLVIVGAANANFSNLENNKILQNERVLFTGYVSEADLIYLYKHAFAFVYPSLFEGFGIPPLEAMACGCPTIVSDIPSLREVCGAASYYINPNDTASITKGLEKFLQDPVLRHHLSQEGLERVKMFSWANSVPVLKEILNTINQN